jgi:hypothetical protein
MQTYAESHINPVPKKKGQTFVAKMTFEGLSQGR